MLTTKLEMQYIDGQMNRRNDSYIWWIDDTTPNPSHSRMLAGKAEASKAEADLHRISLISPKPQLRVQQGTPVKKGPL
jgi:hypothetical protein